jgi:hypothetical protein
MDQFRVWDSFFLSIRLIFPHFLIICIITAALTLLSLFRTTETSRQIGTIQWLLNRSVAIFAFSALGFVLAYFLSLGISPEGATNSLASYIAAPLVALVTAGIAYLDAQDPDAPGAPRTGMAAFLLTAVICYQTLFFQHTVIWKTL